jgi:hypothetical protein
VSALSTVSGGGVYWRGLLVCAIDGTIMSMADSAANLRVFTKQPGGANGGSSYPTLRLLAVVACGTRRSSTRPSAPSVAVNHLRTKAAAQSARRDAAAGRPQPLY